MKELFLAAHEELIEEYLEAHPDADWQEAYEKTSDATYLRYQDKFAALCDEAKDRKKYDIPK